MSSLILSPTPKDSTKEWHQFKDEIHTLYLAQNRPLDGADGVMQLMKDQFGFEKTKAQFVTQLRKWGYSKYSSKDTSPRDWKTASFKVSKARKSGKNVRVFHRGKRVTDKVIRTKGYLTAADQYSFQASAMSPQTPEEFVIHVQTPPPTISMGVPFGNFWNTFNDLEAQFEPKDQLGDTCSALLKPTSSQSMPSQMRAFLPESIELPLLESNARALRELNTGHRLQFITYILSNNLESYFETWLDRSTMEKIKGRLLGIIKMMGFPNLLSSANFSRSPSSQALLESIFRLSVEAEDLPTVQYLLESGMHPNRHRCYHSQLSRYLHLTPLQFALLSGNLSMAGLLMDHDATLDSPGTGWRSSSIALAIIGWHLRRESQIRDLEDTELSAEQNGRTITLFVKSLISRGAAINVEELEIPPSHHDHFGHPLSQPWYKWCTPLTIAARYGLDELVEILLHDESVLNHGYKALELTSAISETLHDCFEWCLSRDGGGYRTLHDCESEMSEGGEDDTAWSIPYRIVPTFPTNIISSLLEAGACVNGNITYCDADDEVEMHITELNAFSSIWSTASQQLMDAGAEPTGKALGICVAKSNLETFKIFLSARTSDRTEDLGGVLQALKPTQIQWLQLIFDHATGLPRKLEILQLAIDKCTFVVWANFVRSSERATSLVCQYPDADGIIPALSTLTPEILGKVSGTPLEWLMKDSTRSSELLYLSVVHDNIPLTEFLVEIGVMLDMVTQHEGREDTALCAAIRHGNKDMFELLIGVGASLVVPTGRLCSCGHPACINALVTAVESGDLELSRRLLEQGADINGYGISRFSNADVWASVPPEQIRSMRLCRCNCAPPLTAYLRVGSNLNILLALLDSGANLNGLSGLFENLASHLTPLASLFLSPIHQRCDSEYKLLATQALLDAGSSPFDIFAISSILPHGTASFNALKVLLWRFVQHSSSGMVPGNIGAIALLQAVKMQDAILVKAILDLKVSGNFQIDIGPLAHPVAEAVDARNSHDRPDEMLAIVEFLLEAGYVPQGLVPSSKSESYLARDWISPIYRALSSGSLELLRLLLNAGVRPTAAEYAAHGCPFQAIIHSAASLELCEILFNHGILPSSQPSPIMRVAFNPPHGVMMQTALQSAAAHNRGDLVKLMVSRGFDINAAGNEKAGATALQLSLMAECFEMAELLMSEGADINAPPSSYNGRTCLQIVAAEGNLGWVKLLARRGAGVNAEPRGDRPVAGTALQLAVAGGHIETVKYLVDHGADVNASPAPARGATALQFAAMHGFLAIAEFLIGQGADPGAMPAKEDGRTALEGAAEHGLMDMVQLLLAQEAFVTNVPREHVELACERAGNNGHMAIEELIRTQLLEMLNV